MLNIFKNKFFVLIVVTLITLVAIGFSAREDSRFNWLGNIVTIGLSPFQKVISMAGGKLEASFTLFRDIREMKQENAALKLQIDQLQKENMDLQEYKLKIKDLKDALNLKDQFNDYDFVGANVIAKDPGNWFSVFRIDRGTKEGIDSSKKGAYFPVITSKGLVGRVINSDPFSAKVIAVIDPDSTVSARVSKTRDIVILKGDITLKDQGLCRLEYLSPDIDIAVGDTVETSGLGGIYPKGIIIGKVKEIRQTSNELNRYAIIEPAVDFKRLEEVMVLKAKEK